MSASNKYESREKINVAAQRTLLVDSGSETDCNACEGYAAVRRAEEKEKKERDEIKWKGQMRKCRDTERWPSKQSNGKRRVYRERKWRIQAQQGKWTDKLMESLAVHRDGTWINTSQLAFKIVIDCRAIIILYFMREATGIWTLKKTVEWGRRKSDHCQDGVFNETSHHPSWIIYCLRSVATGSASGWKVSCPSMLEN